jgi:Uma2 family endonuclease
VLDAPPEKVAEVLEGELHLHSRPARKHTRTASSLGAFIFSHVDDAGLDGRGPGGWVIVDEPELHLKGDILVPDLAGWHEARFPEDEDTLDEAYFTTAPDWVCEVLSDSTACIDRMKKVPIYAREKVANVWIVDPRDRTLEVLELSGASYRLVGTRGADEGPFAMPPFEAAPIPARSVWGRPIRRRP